MASINDLADLSTLPKLPDENSVSLRYLRIIERWIPTGVSYYGTWPDRPHCGHFFGGAHWYGLGTAWSAEAFACAASSPDYREAATGVSRDDLIRMAVSAVRYLCFTHDTGPADCVRPSPPKAHRVNCGTKWGERGRGWFPESQCTWSIGPMTRICALLRDHLDAETLGMVARVVEDYALRFDEQRPWVGVYGDTQTEENGWTAWGFASAATTLARHERAEKWLDNVRRWSFCIATTPQDGRNRGSVAGTPVRDYCHRHVTTLPDYWAENHGVVHPTYTASGILFAANIAIQCRMFGLDIPEEVFWNRREVYANLKQMVDDYGFMLAPQGMDWNYLPGLAGSNLPHAFASVFLDDAEAAALERRTLKQAEMRLESFHGRFYDPDVADRAQDVQDPLYLRELCVNQAAWGYLFHRLFGPGTEPLAEEELGARLNRATVWQHAGTAHNRHPHGQTALSWRNVVMALPVTREGITVIGPASGSFLGQPVVKDRPDSQHLVSCEVDRTENGFAATLIMDRAQRSLRQFVLFASLPDGRTLSFERFEAAEDIVVEKLNQGELAIINERFSAYPDDNCRGERILYTPDGEKTFKGWLGDSEADDERVELGSPASINIDDRIGFVFRGSGDSHYLNRHFHKPFHAIHDRLVLSQTLQGATFRAGETVASLATLVLPEQTHADTEREWLELLHAPDDAVALMTRGALATANFDDTDRLLSFATKRREAIQVFPGATARINEEGCRYELRAPANRATAFEAAGEIIVSNSAAVDVAPDGRFLVTNTGGVPVEAVRDGNRSSRVTVEPGEVAAV